MRRRRRPLLVFGLIAFIFYVSYKILEPEIWGEDLSEKEKEELNKLRIRHQIEGKENFRTHSHTNISDISTERIIAELVKKYRLDFKQPLLDSPWTIAKNWVTLRNVHPSDTPELGAILHSMVTRKITQADVGYKGTQLKMTLVLEGGQKVVFKPKWFSREHVIEGEPYAGEDRHNGEIASFHLGRLLEYRRTPLVVGHVVDMATDIEPVAAQRLKDTFYTRNSNFCFYGKCYYCKGEDTGVCGQGTKLEGALVLWLPDHMKLKKFKHPWSRTYKNNTLAKWETDNDYCHTTVLKSSQYNTGPRLMDVIDTCVLDYLVGNADRHQYETVTDDPWETDNNYCHTTVLKSSQYNTGPRLLDVIDTCVLDYLVGNADRHQYETVTDDPSAMMLLLDNGKSFGNPYHDERSILAPLYQCCSIRESTWSRLLILQEGVLSAVLRELLAQDPIAPIITELHYKALDRRLKHILMTIKACIAKHGVDNVMVKDR